MPRSDDFKTAIALAVAELKHLNPKRLENRTGAQHFVEAAQEGLIVPYFGQAWRITWPEVRVTPDNGQGEISLPEQILILHYLLHASGDLLTGRTIDFRQVPEGGFYWSAFISRGPKAVAFDLRERYRALRKGSGQPGRTLAPGRCPRPGSWPFPGYPSPMSCGGETRNFTPGDPPVRRNHLPVSPHRGHRRPRRASVYRLMGAARQFPPI